MQITVEYLGTRNRFVESFVNSNSALLEKLFQIDSEIEQERQGWMNSNAPGQLAEMWVNILEENNLLGASREKSLAKQIAAERASLFGSVRGESAVNLVQDRIIQQLSRPLQMKLAAIHELEEEHRREFKQSTRQLREDQTGAADELLTSWVNLMTSGIGYLVDFAHFLQLEEFKDIRYEVSPFLKALERHRARRDSGHHDLLEQVKKTAVLNSAQHPAAEELGEFTSHLESKSKKNGGAHLTEWLLFSSYPSGGIDAEAILERIKNGFYPADLKVSYTHFLDEALIPIVTGIRRDLSQYKDPEVPTLNLDLKIQFTKKKSVLSQAKSVESRTVSAEPVEKPKYLLHLHSTVQRYLGTSDEDLEEYVRKTANGFAGSDPRMVEDLWLIINAIKEDPYGLGIAKLHSRPTVLDSFSERKAPLWYFRPAKRPNLALQRPESQMLRPIFYFVRNQAVVLERIVDHDKFDTLIPSDFK